MMDKNEIIEGLRNALEYYADYSRDDRKDICRDDCSELYLHRGEVARQALNIFSETTSNKEYYHDFTFLLGDVLIQDQVANSLFDAGCNDATLCFREGQGSLIFTRKAKNLVDAIISAFNDVNYAGIKVIKIILH